MDSGVKYARSGDFHIAYRTIGDGPVDLALSLGFISHLEHQLADPHMRGLIDRLASFSRLILYDRRGIGLSDPVENPPTLEQQADDLRAVLDAVGSKRTAICSHNLGGAFALLFAASEPERVSHLVLLSCFARMSWAPDYDWANTPEQREAFIEGWLSRWGSGDIVDLMMPSMSRDAKFREWWGALERLSTGPGAMRKYMYLTGEIDVRDILPSVRTPTLVMHAEGSLLLDVRHANYLAEHIPGARYVPIPGVDNLAIQPADQQFVADEIEEFITGERHSAPLDRVLSTVLFTDIVGSTERAAELGDRAWRGVLDRHDELTRLEVERFRGREVKATGDGFLLAFDGPERAIRCAMAINESSHDAGVPLRVGLHTGECEVRGSDLGGMAVHIGARVASMAQAGEVLVTQTVRDLVVGSKLDFAGRGEHQLKGVPGSWRLFAVNQPDSALEQTA